MLALSIVNPVLVGRIIGDGMIAIAPGDSGRL